MLSETTTSTSDIRISPSTPIQWIQPRELRRIKKQLKDKEFWEDQQIWKTGTQTRCCLVYLRPASISSRKFRLALENLLWKWFLRRGGIQLQRLLQQSHQGRVPLLFQWIKGRIGILGVTSIYDPFHSMEDNFWVVTRSRKISRVTFLSSSNASWSHAMEMILMCWSQLWRSVVSNNDVLWSCAADPALSQARF